mmetsp:Transcript_65205/g.115059  ORF Transcript_65205/g.115059 Transcript_65205/m.115059 type:complete len:206 (-) Transcript_65205:525-1142(-)
MFHTARIKLNYCMAKKISTQQNRSGVHSSHLVSLVYRLASFALRQQVVDHRVKKHTGNADGAADGLQTRDGFVEHNRRAHDDHHTLGGVGHGVGHGRNLSERHRCQLIVAVEGQACQDEVLRELGVGLEEMHKLVEFVSLGGNEYRHGGEERDDHHDGELVAHTAHALLQTRRRHQLVALGTLESREEVGNQRSDQSTHGEVQLD